MLWLTCIAVLLCSYLLTRHLGTGFLLGSAIAVFTVAGIAHLLFQAICRRRIKMWTLVIVLPLIVGIAAMALREMSSGRRQKDLATRAHIKLEEFHHEGFRASVQSFVQLILGDSYRDMIALDIRKIAFRLDVVQFHELRKLSLNRMEEVTVLCNTTASITKTSIDWLNRLHPSVRVELTAISLTSKDVTELSFLTKRIDRFVLNTMALNPTELSVILVLPTRELGLRAVTIEDPSLITATPAKSEVLSLSGPCSTYAVELARLKKCTSLRFALSDNPQKDCEEVVALPNLRELHITGPTGKPQLELLLQARQLRKLKVAAIGITDDEIEVFNDKKPPGLELTFLKRWW